MNTTPPWQIVHTRLRELATRRAGLDADEARWLREGLRLRIWRQLGHPTMLSYLEDTLGYGPRAAYERVRVANALGELPAMEESLAKGELSYSAVRELTRVATVKTEGEWLKAAQEKNLRQVEELVAGHLPGDLPNDPCRPEAEMRTLHFQVSRSTFALRREARKILEEECGQSLDDEAFELMLCQMVIEGRSSAPRTRPLHQIAITVCDRCRRGWQDGAGAVIEIDAAEVENAMCDAEHIGPLEGKPHRAKQDISAKTRRHVYRRDHNRCRIPGCRSARNIQVHHIVSRADGGTHDPSNLVLICCAHHSAIHKGIITLRGTAEAIEVEKTAEAAIMVDEACAALVRVGVEAPQARKLVEEARAHVGTRSVYAIIQEALRRSKST